MSDDALSIFLALVLVGVLFAVAYTVVINPPRHAEAIAAGRIVWGMTEEEVLEVWGSPDDIIVHRRMTTGWFSAAELITWVYHNPFRKVTFADEGFGGRVQKVTGQ